MILKGVQNLDINQSEWEDTGRQGEEPFSVRWRKWFSEKKLSLFPHALKCLKTR